MYLNELQENTERQFLKIRNTIHKQNEKFNKEIEIIKKNQTETLELKNTISELKNATYSITSRTNEAEERICALEDRNFEIIQSRKAKKKRMKKSEESLLTYGYHQKKQYVNYWSPRRRAGEGGRKFI